MRIELVEPEENDLIDCHLQQIGMGSLICRAAIQTGEENRTNEVSPAICFNCEVGRIFREVGCDAPAPKISIRKFGFGNQTQIEIEGIFCKIRRRYTTFEYCRTCTLAGAESTRQIVTSTRGLFQSHEFFSSYQDLEKARFAIRDGEFERAITHSVSCLESTCRIIHEQLGRDLPQKRSLADLWKSTRAVLSLDSMSTDADIPALLNNLHGTVTKLGEMRNALSDAHGRGQTTAQPSEALAELAMNSAATLATFAVRHYLRTAAVETLE